MLALTVKNGGYVVLKKDGKVLGRVCFISGPASQVRLGFELPEDIIVLRSKVAENEEAA